jgi:hypothetical protein
MKGGKAARDFDGPYMAVQDPAIMGKGMIRSTTFGVIGRTKMTDPTRTLGGLVTRPVRHPGADGELVRGPPKLIHTERCVTGPASKTHISGQHFGMTPYPGRFMAALGEEL